MLRPSPNHGTQRLPNDDDERTIVIGFAEPLGEVGFRVYIIYINFYFRHG